MDFPAVSQLAVGGSHSCARVGSVAWCWGLNNLGQLGNGTIINTNHPVEVKSRSGVYPLGGIVALAVRADHSCALLSANDARDESDHERGT